MSKQSILSLSFVLVGLLVLLAFFTLRPTPSPVNLSLAAEPLTYSGFLGLPRPIDTTIRPVRGGYANTSNRFTTRFAPDPTVGNAITFQHGSSRLSFSTPRDQSFGTLLSPAPPIARANTLTYPELFPALDLKYTLTHSRLLEEFIVHNPATASLLTSLTQEITLTNIDDFRQEGGGVQFYRRGQLVLSLPRPVLYELGDQTQASYDIQYRLHQEDAQHLTISKVITPDGVSWLQDHSRTYPIAIDLVIDNADTASNWVSSDSTLLTSAQETTITHEGTGSVKLTPTASWYSYSWPYRVKLTIDSTKVGADQTDFPVYVNLNNLPAAFHTSVNQTDARDIRVTTSNGTTELPREVVFYTSGSDTGELHFKYTGTLSSSSNTDIYIYYGNSGASDYSASDTYGKNNVWDSNYVGVWHLQESGNGTTDEYKDSTVNSFDGTGGSSAYPAQATGQLGNGQDCDGSNDIITVGNISSVLNLISATPPTYNISTWFKKSDALGGDLGGIGLSRNGTSTSAYTRLLYRTGTNIASQVIAGSTLLNKASATGSWYHSVGGYDSSTTKLTLNVNNSASTDTTSALIDNSTQNMHMTICNAQSYYKGLVDEVRVSSTRRSATWITTEYNNQNSPSTFFSSFGAEQSIVAQTATRTVGATDLSSYDSITYWVRSDRTGSFMRFQLGESTSSEQTNAITISSANTWEQKTWNISGITNSSIDAVTKYAFYVTDASTTFSFYFDDIQASINNSAPATPSLDSPADSATNQSLTPALLTTTTDADSDYLRYKIQLCENAGMSTNCQTFDQTASQTGWSGQNTQSNTAYTSGTQATYTVQTPLSASFTYYWRSYAIDPGGTNTWSGTQTPRSFTTTTAPSSPTTPYAEGASNPTGIVDLTPEFSAIHNDANADAAVFYEIEVNTQSDFAGTVMWDTGQTSMSSLADGVRSTDVSYAGTALTYSGTTYYWRIRFTDNKGAVGAWSATQNFSTNAVSSTPSLDSPTDTATGVSVTPALLTTTTDPNSDYLRYKIELCENAGMSTNCQTFNQTASQTGWSGQNTQGNTAYTSSTQATYTIQSALSYSFTYYWRSYAIDPGGTNTWSATQGTPYSFTTLAAPAGATNFIFQGLKMSGLKLN